MKKIVNTSPPVVMATRRTPLSIMLTIEQVDGKPVTQAQDTQQSLWIPDRTLSPLILNPIFQVYDADAGSIVTVTRDVKWYLNKEQTWDGTDGQITSTTTSSDYYLETSGGNPTGRLVVRKNIDYRTPQTLICTVTYTDATHGESYYASDMIVLTSENKPDDFYSLNIETPSTVKYRPFSDASSQKTFKLTVYKGHSALTATELAAIKIFWYLDDTLLVNDGTCPYYVSGQNTDTLVIDAEYCNNAEIKARIGSTASAASPDIQAFDRKTLIWEFPHITCLPYSTNGSAVSADGTPKRFEGIVQENGVDVLAAKQAEYVRLNWKYKLTLSSTTNDVGWGDFVTIAASTLRQLTGNVDVFADLYLLENYEILTYNDEAVVDDVLNDGYVVGRC